LHLLRRDLWLGCGLGLWRLPGTALPAALPIAALSPAATGLRRRLRLRGRLGLRTALRAALPVAALLPLALVGLMPLGYLVGEIGRPATLGHKWTGRAIGVHLRSGLGLRWSRPAMRMTATMATARTAVMVMSGLSERGGGGQGQDGNGYQQTAHVILREITARLITGLYRFGFPLARLWSAHA